MKNNNKQVGSNHRRNSKWGGTIARGGQMYLKKNMGVASKEQPWGSRDVE